MSSISTTKITTATITRPATLVLSCPSCVDECIREKKTCEHVVLIQFGDTNNRDLNKPVYLEIQATQTREYKPPSGLLAASQIYAFPRHKVISFRTRETRFTSSLFDTPIDLHVGCYQAYGDTFAMCSLWGYTVSTVRCSCSGCYFPRNLNKEIDLSICQ